MNGLKLKEDCMSVSHSNDGLSCKHDIQERFVCGLVRCEREDANVEKWKVEKDEATAQSHWARAHAHCSRGCKIALNCFQIN